MVQKGGHLGVAKIKASAGESVCKETVLCVHGLWDDDSMRERLAEPFHDGPQANRNADLSENSETHGHTCTKIQNTVVSV